MQAHKIVIFHPGSRNLRIGRASDLNPVTLLHAIGRRRAQQSNSLTAPVAYSDTLVPALQTAALPEFKEHHAQLKQSFMQSSNTSNKRARVTTPTKQIVAFNKQSFAEELTAANKDTDIKEEATKIKKEKLEQEVLFDNDLLQLNTDVGKLYNVHFPMRRGELNLHAGVGGSMSSVLSDIEAIWRYAITQCMHIDSSAIKTHFAVLVVSDIYNRSHLRELVTLLLQRLGFRSCFVLQDHVAATFGAGLGYACVVDVGDQKCSISCVDDGISQPDTRLRLPFGGADVTRVFYTLLQRNAFPYKECDIENSLKDAALITQLKERFCNLADDAYSMQERTFELQSRDGKRLRYTLQLGDECLVAPLALFHTELLSVTGKQRQARIQLTSSQQPDAEDCFDADYIRDTGRRNGMRGDQLEGNMPLTGDNAEDELVVVDNYDVESAANVKSSSEQKADFAYTGNGQVVCLDQAIMRSIERCATDEMKRKMFGCILLVGGGVKVPGFAKCMEKKLQLQLTSSGIMLRMSDQMPIEINVYMREMDAAMIAWKGAAIMSCLESAPELWITPNEWEKHGLRILREKAPFIW